MNENNNEDGKPDRRLTSAERQELYRKHAEGKLSAQEKQAERKKIILTLCVSVLAVLVIGGAVACIILNQKVWEPSRKYRAAQSLYDSGDYLAAYDAFKALDTYSDSRQKASECILQNAKKLSERDEVVIGDSSSMKWFSIDEEGVLMFDDEIYVGSSDVVIPDVFDGILVRTIKDKAFYYADFMTSVVIPASVTSVGERSFFHCTGLTEIRLPDGLKFIGEYAFSSCSSLKRIYFGSGLREISQRAFRECTSLEAADLPEGLSTIGVRAFNGCTSLRSLSLPSTLTSVGGYAFTECTSLQSVVYNGSSGALSAALSAEDADVILNCPGLVCKKD